MVILVSFISRWGIEAGFCEYDNEISASTIRRVFLDYLKRILAYLYRKLLNST